MPPLQLLDNIAWHSLTGPHAASSAGSALARRYARGFPPIIAFADTARPDFAALEPHCEANELLYCAGWSGPVPPGWQLDADKLMLQMVWRAPPPADDDGFVAVRLGAEHVPQVLDLVALTNPGPSGPRVLELGEYVGCFDGPRLLAMAGERMRAGPLREISGVCTHPDFQGQGLARRLMQLLLRRGLQRGETPFLHVMRDNHPARALYQRMGFLDHQELTVRVLSRLP
jgi:ribosomal protein S18 acetylase RimI-like enzyme